MELAALVDPALLLLRVLIALLFVTSGWSHAAHPEERGESIGLSPVATRFLGIVEMVAAGSVALGVRAELGALLLVLVMVGAIWKKAFAWKTGFWGDEGQGWYYDLLYLACSLVILATRGGGWILV